MSTPRRRPLSREEQIIRRREKEYQHQKFWNDQQKYYDWWGKSNTKYEEWTSPRYYDTNTQLVKQIQMEKAKEERKVQRQQSLRQLYETERLTWCKELMERKVEQSRSPLASPRYKPEEIPTEILREIHQGIKERDEEKRKKEAELKLYHHWRNNNSFIQEFERARRSKDIKMSWLHQQMEKRKQKELEEAEEKRMLLEREEHLKMEREQEAKNRQEMERRNMELKEIIDKQMDQLKLRNEISKQLKLKEENERKRIMELMELEEKEKQLDQLARQRETALFNMKQYKTKLKQKLKNTQEDIEEQEKIMTRLKNLKLAEEIEDKNLREKVKKDMDEYLRISQQQKRLEKTRERQLQILFDSEAQSLYEKQSEMWKIEEESRKKLLRNVLETIGQQIEENQKKSRDEQEALVKERELLEKMNADYNEELKKLQEEKMMKQLERREELDEELKKKHEIKRNLQHEDKLKKITEELERAKIEEERLKREIMNLHRGQGLCRPSSRTNIMF